MTSGTIAKATAESANVTRQTAFTTSPAKAIRERYPHSADSAASALRAVLPVRGLTAAFSPCEQRHKHGCCYQNGDPQKGWLGLLYPDNAMTEAATTQAARMNSSPPAIRAARR